MKPTHRLRYPVTAPWAPSRTRSRDPTRSWAARSRPRGTTRWRRASSSQSWAGGTPTAVPDVTERHCLSIGTSPPVPAFLPPSHLPEWGGGLETFPPLPSPSLLTKRWLSASNLGITATSSLAITPRQEGDISQPNIFFSSGKDGPDLGESHRFPHCEEDAPAPSPSLPIRWQWVSAPLHQHFSDGLSASHAPWFCEKPPGQTISLEPFAGV